MSLLIIGKAATKVMDADPEFAEALAQVPWSHMRGMRNRIANGYLDIDLNLVWNTVETALPELLRQLPAVMLAARIRVAGGGYWALGYVSALQEKIERLEAVGMGQKFFKQLRSAENEGGLRGHILEVNFADLFAQRNIKLEYGKKQGMSGDVDFCWSAEGYQFFIEMKLLGQDKETRDDTARQLADTGSFFFCNSDDTRDVGRIQRDIFSKSCTTKFNPRPAPSWINLVAIDVAELQHGTVDIRDCLLAVGGNELARRYHPLVQRPEVVGVFEPADKALTDEQATWVKRYHGVSDANSPHPRDYIHGVLFLFREPSERAALSYELSGGVVWNPALRDEAREELFLDAFHAIVPRFVVPSC